MLKPLIPQSLTWVALALGAALFGAGQFVPAPYELVCAGLGSVSLFLGGLGWRAPAWAAGKPLLPLGLVPLALASLELLQRFAPMLPETWQGYATAAVGLLSLLAGKVIPEPMKVVPSTDAVGVQTNQLPQGAAVTQVDPTCSFYDRARGLC